MEFKKINSKSFKSKTKVIKSMRAKIDRNKN
jgi:hypothetical protein